MRFHSLPGSKRYAEGEAEYATIAHRFNAILGDVANGHERVALLTTGYSATEAPPIRSYPELDALDSRALPWRTFQYDENGGFCHVFASEWIWSPGIFDDLVRIVADDVIRDVLVVALDGRWLVHPYDGGIDLITEESSTRDAIKAQHAAWLSDHPLGL